MDKYLRFMHQLWINFDMWPAVIFFFGGMF